MKVPFGVSREEERDTCTYALFLEPTGLLVVSYKDSSEKSVESISGVIMRRQKETEYKERQSESFVVFRKNASEYESSAFIIRNNKILTISLSISSNEDFDSKFDEILKGIELF